MTRSINPSCPPAGHGAAPSRRALALATAALWLLFMAGCAADAWRPNPNFSTFLNKVSQQCGSMRLGEFQISDLMNPGSMQSSPLFLDLVSRYDTGAVSQTSFLVGLDDAFNVKADSPAVRCILAQKAP